MSKGSGSAVFLSEESLERIKAAAEWLRANCGASCEMVLERQRIMVLACGEWMPCAWLEAA